MGLTFFFKIKLRFFGDFFCVSSVGLRNVGSTCSTSKQTKTKRSAEGWHYVIATLDGAEWLNRQLKVNKARPRENRSSFGGGYRNKRF